MASRYPNAELKDVFAHRAMGVIVEAFEDREFTTYQAALQIPIAMEISFSSHEAKTRRFLKSAPCISTRRVINVDWHRIKYD